VRLIHPAVRLVAQVFELTRQAFADLARAALDLAPVARLDLQALGETALEASQRGGVGMLDVLANELIEQQQSVVQADLRDVRQAGRHVSNDKGVFTCLRKR
jgi:hypothetical protein